MPQIAHIGYVLRNYSNGVVVTPEFLKPREHAYLARNLVKAVLGDICIERKRAGHMYIHRAQLDANWRSRQYKCMHELHPSAMNA